MAGSFATTRWRHAFRVRSALLGLTALTLLLSSAVAPFSTSAASPPPIAFDSFDGAGADRDLGAATSRDYLTTTLTLTKQSWVRASFTGYVFAKSSGAGIANPGCPCLVRGELRANDGPRAIVTRSVIGTDANDIAGDADTAAADRRDVSGSEVYALPAGTHTFTMSLVREVGTAQNIGFAFGRLQAEVLSQAAFTSFNGAGPDRDLGPTNPRDYLTISLTVPEQSQVRVSFTGYVFAKAAMVGVQTPGCPCLVRGELRANDGPRSIVSRQVLASDANDIVGDPLATPPVAAAQRVDMSGSQVYSLPPGQHTFTMSLRRETGTAQNVGFAFGRMQAEVLPKLATGAFTSFDGAGSDRDLGALNPRDYLSVTVRVAQPSAVRVNFTGYVFAKSTAVGVANPDCPCLVRGELRMNDGPKSIVTRSIVGSDADDIAGDAGATPPVATADRRDISGSQVYLVNPGTHAFTMSLMREVGNAANVGFAFGRMQAAVLPKETAQCAAGRVTKTIVGIDPAGGDLNVYRPTELAGTGNAPQGSRLTIQPPGNNAVVQVQQGDAVVNKVSVVGLDPVSTPGLVLRDRFQGNFQSLTDIVASNGASATQFSGPGLPTGFAYALDGDKVMLYNIPTVNGFYADVYLVTRITASRGYITNNVAVAGMVSGARVVSLSGICGQSADSRIVSGLGGLLGTPMPLDLVPGRPF